MRPLKLIMTGFESYKDRTEINFEELGIKGLYLITGDTGAGKTTIFDAITFALYGSPSGSDRSVDMLRSHFADEKTPTVVELDFEANGKKYHITRNPDYERKALRGEGTTKEPANAVISFLSESREPVSGVVKVNAEVEAILKLKKEQFCRIAMIAQGRFQELLLSNKKQKEEIFRELFHTEKYERLQNELKTEKSKAERTISDLNIKLHEALTRIEVSETYADADKINQIKNSNYVGEEDILLLKDYVSKNEQLLGEVLTKITDVEEKLEKTNSELQNGENRKNLELQIKTFETAQTEKKETVSKLEEEVKAAEEEAKKVPDLEKEKTLLEASLKDYEEIAKAEGELKNLTSAISTDEKTKAALENDINNLSTKVDALKKEQAELKNAGEKIGALEITLEKISDENSDLEDIENQIDELSEEKEDFAAAQEKVKESVVAFENANQIYTEKLRLFNLEQAGILADGLAEGSPCPVCGSTNHPNLAKKSEKAPTQKEIETAKNTADKLQKSSIDISTEAAQKKTAIEKSEEAINKLLKKYFENLSVTDNQLGVKLEERKAQIEAEEKTVKENLLKEKKEKAHREEIEKQIPSIETELKNKNTELTQLSVKISGEKSKLEADTKNLAAKKTGLKYETLVEAKENFEALDKKISVLKTNLDSAKEKKSACEKEIENLKGKIESLKTQLENTKPVDVDKLLSEKEELLSSKEALELQRKSLYECNAINTASVASVEELVPEIATATAHYNTVSSLSDVASGSSRGKNGKPSLETFVQMHCLDQINRRANLRLKTMTENKYELHRRIEEDGSELGLDLDIKDFYTGRKRTVQSLSGGEQFQASLALALGLADEVQENSGGIKLDTMFIDEGFGTLDPETLNKAMKALEELSSNNRLIGIISHVEELESRIPNKIIVKKDTVGVSHATIEVE